MSVTFECDKLVNKLRAIGDKDIASNIVKQLVARGLNIAKPLAQATKSDVAAGIVADPLEVTGGSATGGFSVNHQLAPFFEYGTGRPGHQGAVSNGQERNPAAGGFAFTLQTTIMSGPNAGQQRKGWVYFKNGRFYHTFGQPARPFMYPAQSALEQEAAQIAGVAVRDAIRG